MASGVLRLVQTDFSGGMFPELAPELIPANGAFDISNGLLNEQNVVYRRGGTAYLASAPGGALPRLLWSGRLKNGGQQTILATSTNTWRVNPSGALTLLTMGVPSALCKGVVFQGRLYVPGAGNVSFDGTTAGGDGRVPKATAYAVAGNRLIAGAGSRIDVSKVPAAEGDAVTWAEATNYLVLPEGVTITGMAGWRQSVVVFTTEGVYLVNGLGHKDITDVDGNIQWSQDRYSADATLWDQAGLAAWKGGLVVPCRDDVWLMQLGVSSEKSAPFHSISGPIRNVYRGYVEAGFKPGAATVFQGHYFLPILNGSSVIDMLVCRLEGVGKGAPAWTHLTGYGAQVAALTPAGTDLEGPLMGATAGLARVLKLAYLTPGAAVATDADGSDISFSITTRSIPTGSLVANTILKARLSYRLVAGPASKMTLEFGNTPYGGASWGEFNWGEASWTSATGPFTDLGEATPAAKADPEALVPKTWRVNRKVRFARMRIALNGPASQASIRALELGVRPSGRLF